MNSITKGMKAQRRLCRTKSAPQTGYKTQCLLMLTEDRLATLYRPRPPPRTSTYASGGVRKAENAERPSETDRAVKTDTPCACTASSPAEVCHARFPPLSPLVRGRRIACAYQSPPFFRNAVERRQQVRGACVQRCGVVRCTCRQHGTVLGRQCAAEGRRGVQAEGSSVAGGAAGARAAGRRPPSPTFCRGKTVSRYQPHTHRRYRCLLPRETYAIAYMPPVRAKHRGRHHLSVVQR
jgi:hypothetical protein